VRRAVQEGGGGLCAAGGGLLCGEQCLRRAVWCVLLWGGGTRACLSGGIWGRGDEFVITAWRGTRCMENISCVGQYWMRGAILDAWGNIGCVGQYRMRGAILAACRGALLGVHRAQHGPSTTERQYWMRGAISDAWGNIGCVSWGTPGSPPRAARPIDHRKWLRIVKKN
jgi:hypothetical protein